MLLPGFFNIKVILVDFLEILSKLGGIIPRRVFVAIGVSDKFSIIFAVLSSQLNVILVVFVLFVIAVLILPFL